MHRHTVPAGVAATPISRYLSRAFPSLPGWLIRDTLKKKDVRINGIKCGPDASVRSGDELTIYIDDKYFRAPLKILFENEQLLITEKPAGIPVSSDQSNIGSDTMLSRIQAHCPSAQLCHRLDTGTGGVLIAAKTEAALQEMIEAFRGHELTKKYQCLVAGRPDRPEAKLKDYLIKDASASKVRIVRSAQPGALTVETHYRVLDTKNDVSLLEVTLITGRTHQIRAHLSSVGLPLIGDDKYGNREINRRTNRSQPALWCTEIRWKDYLFKSEPPFHL